MRALESEVRELKSLLDEKDEKIDVLSRIHSFSPPSQRAASTRSPSQSAAVTARSSISDSAEGMIHVERSLPQSASPKSSNKPYTALSSTQGLAGMLEHPPLPRYAQV